LQAIKQDVEFPIEECVQALNLLLGEAGHGDDDRPVRGSSVKVMVSRRNSWPFQDRASIDSEYLLKGFRGLFSKALVDERIIATALFSDERRQGS
jgi:hypothetical protein